MKLFLSITGGGREGEDAVCDLGWKKKIGHGGLR